MTSRPPTSTPRGYGCRDGCRRSWGRRCRAAAASLPNRLVGATRGDDVARQEIVDDRDAAARLWSASEELAGLKFAPS